MRSKHVIAGAVLAAALMPLRAHAVTEQNFGARTMEDLVTLCSADPKEPMGVAARNFCHGYAQGAIEVQLERQGRHRRFCFPNPSPSRSTTLDEFVQWARAHQDRMSDRAADSLFAFMTERFPCPGKK
jgi:hypothetical protein